MGIRKADQKASHIHLVVASDLGIKGPITSCNNVNITQETNVAMAQRVDGAVSGRARKHKHPALTSKKSLQLSVGGTEIKVKERVEMLLRLIGPEIGQSLRDGDCD